MKANLNKKYLLSLIGSIIISTNALGGGGFVHGDKVDGTNDLLKNAIKSIEIKAKDGLYKALVNGDSKKKLQGAEVSKVTEKESKKEFGKDLGGAKNVK